LGETGAVLARVGDLYPGIAAHRLESPAAVEVKGRVAMVDVLKRAVRTRQRVLREDAAVGFGAVQLRVTPHVSQAARRRARAAGRRGLSEDDVAAIHRPLDDDGDGDGGWSAADVPLLDEAADLLGEAQRPARRRRRRRDEEGDGHHHSRTIGEMARADRTW